MVTDFQLDWAKPKAGQIRKQIECFPFFLSNRRLWVQQNFTYPAFSRACVEESCIHSHVHVLPLITWLSPASLHCGGFHSLPAPSAAGPGNLNWPRQTHTWRLFLLTNIIKVQAIHLQFPQFYHIKTTGKFNMNASLMNSLTQEYCLHQNLLSIQLISLINLLKRKHRMINTSAADSSVGFNGILSLYKKCILTKWGPYMQLCILKNPRGVKTISVQLKAKIFPVW